MSKFNNQFNWTDKVTLQKHFEDLMVQLCKANDQRFKELEDKMDLRFKLNQTAIDKAESATNIRLEGMNEFRTAMKDQTEKFITREEGELKYDSINTKLDSLQKITYMGLGALAAIEFILKFFVR